MIKSFLFDEKTFYRQFLRDLKECKSEVIIESPFITTSRMKSLIPTFSKLVKRGVKVYVITRNPNEHVNPYKPPI